MRKSRLISYFSLSAVCCSNFSPAVSTFAEDFEDENEIIKTFISKMVFQEHKWIDTTSIEEIFLMSLKKSDIAKKLKKEKNFYSFFEKLREVINCRTMIFNYIKSTYERCFNKEDTSSVCSLVNLYKLITLFTGKEENVPNKEQKKIYKIITRIFYANGQNKGEDVNVFFTRQLKETVELIEKNSKKDPKVVSSYLQSEGAMLHFFNRLMKLGPEPLFVIYTFYKGLKDSKKGVYNEKKPVIEELERENFFEYLTKEEKDEIESEGSKICAYLVELRNGKYLLYALLDSNNFTIKSIKNKKTYAIDGDFFNFFEKLLKSYKIIRKIDKSLKKEAASSSYDKFFKPIYKKALINGNFLIMGKINSFSTNFYDDQDNPKLLGKLKLIKEKRNEEKSSKFSVKDEDLPVEKKKTNSYDLLKDLGNLNIISEKKIENNTSFLKKKRNLFNVIKAEEIKKVESKHENLNCFKEGEKSSKKRVEFFTYKRPSGFALDSFENNIESIFPSKSSSVIFSNCSLFSNRNIFNESKGNFNFLLGNILNKEPEG